jgi:hypothetical protein
LLSSIHPLIRGDISFSGWEPIDDEELQRFRQAMTRPDAVAGKAVSDHDQNDR